MSDGYEPGSTFKLITLASALDSGAITLNDSFYCGGQEKFAGRDQILNCWKSAGHGAQTTAQALGNSCNIAFGHIGMRMGGDTFYDYLKAFGIMEKTGVDLPGEGRGLFYDKKTLTDTATYGTSYLITSSFGQSFRITPMQLVRSVAAIVNGGYVLQPYVVSEVLDENGNTVQTNEKTVLRQVISQQTSETMRDLMEKVVTEGTASAAKTPGYRVARPVHPKSWTNTTRTASRSRIRSSPSSASRRSTIRNTSSLSPSIRRPIPRIAKNTPSTACTFPAA